MNFYRIAYYIFLSLFSLIILRSLYDFFFSYDNVIVEFASLGYPEHLILPLAIAQILGLTILIARKGKWLMDWAYSGFFINLAIAIIAHYHADDGNGAFAVLGLVCLWSTFILGKQLMYRKEKNEHHVQKELNDGVHITS